MAKKKRVTRRGDGHSIMRTRVIDASELHEGVIHELNEVLPDEEPQEQSTVNKESDSESDDDDEKDEDNNDKSKNTSDVKNNQSNNKDDSDEEEDDSDEEEDDDVDNIPFVHNRFVHTMMRMCGLTNTQVKILYKEGITSADTIILLRDEDLEQCFDDKNKPNMIVRAKMRGFIHWIREKYELYGADYDIDIRHFTEQECRRVTMKASAPKRSSEYVSGVIVK